MPGAPVAPTLPVPFQAADSHVEQEATKGKAEL